MVGIVDDIDNKMTMYFKNAGDKIVLIGEQKNDIASSEYLHKIKGIEFSPAPAFDLEEEFNVQQFIATLIKEKIINSAHDISEGGLMITLMEKGFCNNLGFEINTNKVSNYNSIRQDAFWFGEAQSRVVVTVSENIFQQLQAKATQANIAFTELGVVTTSAIKINNENFENSIAWKEKYDTAIEKYLA